MSTNIPFLQAVLDDPDFRAGRITTSFIDERPGLLTSRSSADRGSKILAYLADVTVNKPHGERPTTVYPRDKLPLVERALLASPPDGSRQRLLALGPEGFARDLRENPRLGITDTTFRDAHQSLLATRVRTTGLVTVAPYVAALTPELLSVECWGGATYDVALRFLKEDPWDRLAQLREAIPNICLQMLLRGANTVGYTPYPTKVTTAFVAEATDVGIDIFRIFDALNNVDAMRPAIDAVRETGRAVAEVAMSYTGDLMDPAEDLYTLDYYLRRRSWCRLCGRTSTSRSTCTPTTRRAGSWRRTSPHGRPARMRSTVRRPRSPEPPASRRCRPSSPPPRTPTATPAWTWGGSATSSPTGKPCERCTRPSNPGFRRRPGACTPTRSRADSCRTCASRRSPWGWAIAVSYTHLTLPTNREV